jgi:hypothetical protein
MPGKKDCVSVMVDGERKHLQKQLVLCNLKEAYSSFKEKFPRAKIGFSKFAELRPKQCVLAGSSGTHSVCVCTTHQNMKHHAFITRAQSTFYSDTKPDMKEGEVLVVCDFAENYSFVVQDEIQSFHWNNEMATVHPFVAYYKTGTIINHVNFVVISECNTHDTGAVH